MPTSWTKDEEKQLITELKDNKSFDEISKIHNRSISALMMRYNKIIFDNIEAGKSKKSLAKLLNTTIDKITQSYYEHKAFMEKKQTIKNEEQVNANKDKIKDEVIDKVIDKVKDKEIKENKEIKKDEEKDKSTKRLQKENKILKGIVQKLENKKQLEKFLNNKELYNYVMKILKKI
jgi:hypothetical protein